MSSYNISWMDPWKHNNASVVLVFIGLCIFLVSVQHQAITKTNSKLLSFVPGELTSVTIIQNIIF